MVALRFKALHIAPWIHQKIMLPLQFLEHNFVKWDTEKIIHDSGRTAVFNSVELKMADKVKVWWMKL